jgi:hypothetical protein
MRADWECDLSFHEYIKTARAYTTPAARLFAYEDYVRDRAHEVFRLVNEHPTECSCRAFDFALYGTPDHVSCIVVNHSVRKTLSSGAQYDFHIYDITIFDDQGVVFEAAGMHPVLAQQAVQQAVLNASSNRPRTWQQHATWQLCRRPR